MLKVNEYFDGQVKSIGFQSATLASSVGVMAPGEYEFDTSQFETMSVVSGALTVQLPDSDQWHTYNAGDSFTIDANKVFLLKVEVASAYLCTYE